MGYLYALLGALLFGANGSLTKLIVDGGLTATQLTQFRTLGTALLAGLLLLATDRSGFRLTRRQFLVMVVLGVAGVAVLQASYAAALAILPVGITLLLEYLAVLFVALVASSCSASGCAVGCGWRSGSCSPGSLRWRGRGRRDWNVGSRARPDRRGESHDLLRRRGASGGADVAALGRLWTMLLAGAFWAFFSGWWELDAATFAAPVDVGGQWGSWVLPLGVPLLVTVVAGSFAPFLLSFMALRRLSATRRGSSRRARWCSRSRRRGCGWARRSDGWGIAGALVVLAGIVLAQTARVDKVVDADLVLPAAVDGSGSGSRAGSGSGSRPDRGPDRAPDRARVGSNAGSNVGGRA